MDEIQRLRPTNSFFHRFQSRTGFLSLPISFSRFPTRMTRGNSKTHRLRAPAWWCLFVSRDQPHFFRLLPSQNPAKMMNLKNSFGDLIISQSQKRENTVTSLVQNLLPVLLDRIVFVHLVHLSRLWIHAILIVNSVIRQLMILHNLFEGYVVKLSSFEV